MSRMETGQSNAIEDYLSNDQINLALSPRLHPLGHWSEAICNSNEKPSY